MACIAKPNEPTIPFGNLNLKKNNNNNNLSSLNRQLARYPSNTATDWQISSPINPLLRINDIIRQLAGHYIKETLQIYVVLLERYHCNREIWFERVADLDT